MQTTAGLLDTGLVRKKGAQGVLASVILINGFLPFSPAAFAQIKLGGDFRNVTITISQELMGDIPINVQVDKNGDPSGLTGGITVQGGEKVSFDEKGTLKTGTAGFWKNDEGKVNPLLYSNSQRRKFGLVEVTGSVRWNKKRNVTDGKDNFVRLTMPGDAYKWLQITKRELIGGRLVVTAEDGTRYAIYDLSPDFTLTIDMIEDGNPKSSGPGPSVVSSKSSEPKEQGALPGDDRSREPNCPSCHQPSLASAKFCHNCGHPLPQLCSKCGKEVPLRANFCSNCGTPSVRETPAHQAAQPVYFNAAAKVYHFASNCSRLSNKQKIVRSIRSDGEKKGLKPCAQCENTKKKELVCQSCNRPISSVAKFCPNCGKQIPQLQRCTKCDTELPSVAKFCPNCGQRSAQDLANQKTKVTPSQASIDVPGAGQTTNAKSADQASPLGKPSMATKDKPKEPAKSEAKRTHFVGTISEHEPFGNLSFDFTGSIQGVTFKLRESPDKEFRFYADTFDKLERAGFMVREGGAFTFKHVKGKKVEVDADKIKDSQWKALTIKWLEAETAVPPVTGPLFSEKGRSKVSVEMKDDRYYVVGKGERDLMGDQVFIFDEKNKTARTPKGATIRDAPLPKIIYDHGGLGSNVLSTCNVFEDVIVDVSQLLSKGEEKLNIAVQKKSNGSTCCLIYICFAKQTEFLISPFGVVFPKENPEPSSNAEKGLYVTAVFGNLPAVSGKLIVRRNGKEVLNRNPGGLREVRIQVSDVMDQGDSLEWTFEDALGTVTYSGAFAFPMRGAFPGIVEYGISVRGRIFE